MKRGRYARKRFDFFATATGKHASKKVSFFVSSRGKHARDEIVVYNPLYAKINAYVSSFAVTTSLLTCLSFGKYKQTIATSDVARTAKHLLNLTSSQTSITGFVPETTQSFNFNVSNFEGEIDNPSAKNEVLLKYLIKLEIPETTNIPFEYKLYRIVNGIDEQIEIVDSKSAWINVNDVSQTDAYRLDIMWKQDENDLKYQNLTDNIKISIEFEQIDN